MALGCPLKALDALNSIGLWMIKTTRDPMSLGLYFYEQLKAEENMNDSRS